MARSEGSDKFITDIGTQFFANKKDKNGESKSAFAVFLAKNEIKHILARVKLPQIDGQIEKNGILPARRAESLLMKNTIFSPQRMHFGQDCLMSAS